MPESIRSFGELWRAGAEQHLARRFQLLDLPGLAVLDPDRAPAFHENARGVGVGDHPQVGPAPVGREIGLRRAEALAVAVRHLVHAEAFLSRAVEVRVVPVTGLHGGLHERLAQPGSGCAGPSRSAARPAPW